MLKTLEHCTWLFYFTKNGGTSMHFTVDQIFESRIKKTSELYGCCFNTRKPKYLQIINRKCFRPFYRRVNDYHAVYMIMHDLCVLPHSNIFMTLSKNNDPKVSFTSDKILLSHMGKDSEYTKRFQHCPPNLHEIPS